MIRCRLFQHFNSMLVCSLELSSSLPDPTLSEIRFKCHSNEMSPINTSHPYHSISPSSHCRLIIVKKHVHVGVNSSVWRDRPQVKFDNNLIEEQPYNLVYIILSIIFLGCLPLRTFRCIDSCFVCTESSSEVLFSQKSPLEHVHQRFD